MRAGEQLQVLRGHRGSVRCVAVSEDGTRAYSGSDDCSVRSWVLRPALDTNPTAAAASADMTTAPVVVAAASADTVSKVASDDDDGLIRSVIQPPSDSRVRSLVLHGGLLYAALDDGMQLHPAVLVLTRVVPFNRYRLFVFVRFAVQSMALLVQVQRRHPRNCGV